MFQSSLDISCLHQPFSLMHWLPYLQNAHRQYFYFSHLVWQLHGSSLSCLFFHHPEESWHKQRNNLEIKVITKELILNEKRNFLYRNLFRILPNINDEVFLRKTFMAKSLSLFSRKNSIIDVWHVPEDTFRLSILTIKQFWKILKM